MLRPKQVLPLYNGARAWLAAGTYKSNSLEDSHGSEASHFDETGERSRPFPKRALSNVSEASICSKLSQREVAASSGAEAYIGKPSTGSFRERTSRAGDSFKRAQAEGFIQVPVSSDNFLKPSFSRSRATVDPGVLQINRECSTTRSLPTSVGVTLQAEIFNESEYRQNEKSLADHVHKMGNTVPGGLSDFQDGPRCRKAADGTHYIVQRAGPSSNPSLTTQKIKSDLVDKNFRSPVTSDRVICGLGNSRTLGDKTETKSGIGPRDARKFSSVTQSSDSGKELPSSLIVLTDGFDRMKISKQEKSRKSTACPRKAAGHGPKHQRLRELPDKQRPSTASHLEMSHDETNLPRLNDIPNSCKVKSECPLEVQGSARCGEPRRVAKGINHRAGKVRQAGDIRQGRGAWAQRGPCNDEREIIEHVCNVLRQQRWCQDTEDALLKLDRKLSPYHINEILKEQQEAGLALDFFDWAKKQDGFKHDVHTYTTMVGIVGRARKFDTLTCLMEDMVRDGCEPSIVTFNRLIHCYGRANRMGEALQIFHHMQQVGCQPDKVTYCTLIDLHAKAGFLDVAMDVYRQMQQAGLQPDTFTYSVIINCLGKAGELSASYNVFREMIGRGCVPNLVTYNILLDLHAKSGRYDIALKLYNDMQETGFHPDQVTYSIVMEVLGHVGNLEEAEYVFAEMQEAGLAPDVTVYGLLIDMWGKARNVTKACEWYKSMLDSGVMPNVPTCNSLLGAFLRENLYDAGKQILQDMLVWDLTPSLQTYTLLLSCYTMSERQLDCEMLWNLMASTNHSAHLYLCTLSAEKTEENDTREETIRFFNAIICDAQESKRSFTDALISCLHKFKLKPEAAIVWEVATEKKIYPKTVTKKAPKYWAINLHTMSIGTAIVALSRTLSNLKEQMLATGVVPERIDIITGWGRRSRVTGSSLIKQAVEEILQTVHSPFQLEDGNLGCFIGIGKPLADWLNDSDIEQIHLI